MKLLSPVFLLIGSICTLSVARADEWKSIGAIGGTEYLVDPSTIQHEQRADNRDPTIGIWIRAVGGATFQEWVDCPVRWYSLYYPSATGGWTAWAPIPPETPEWAVWRYLCRAKARH